MSRITRLGCRASIAASACAVSAASRVAYPSSLSTSAISMRISASSSTIRMSKAMADRAQLSQTIRGCLLFLRAGLCCGKNQLHPRALRLAIFQHQLALVIFHDLLDDCEAQARSLGARRHVGLRKPFAALPRQPSAVVFHDHGRLARLNGDRYVDMTGRARPAVGDSRFDRLDGVFDDVHHRLADESCVTANRYGIGGKNRLEDELGMSGALQEYRLARDLVQIFRLEHCRRHPCEG